MTDVDRIIGELRPSSKAIGTDEEIASVVGASLDSTAGITPKDAFGRFDQLVSDLYDHRLADEHKKGLPEPGIRTKIERMEDRVLSSEQAARLLKLEPVLRKDADFGRWDRMRTYLATGKTVKAGRIKLKDSKE